MLLRLQNSVASMGEMVRQQERTANNLANAGTVGYKRDRAFSEALNERLDAEAAPRSDRTITQWADPAQGTLTATGNPLDLALRGEGFFVLTDAATGAPRYTRAGRFMPDGEGTLRDAAGHAVAGEDGPIQLPTRGGTVEVGAGGEVSVDGQAVGRLRIVRFDDPAALRRLDGAAFDGAGQQPLDAAGPQVMQGYLEESNVDPVREMTEMITQFRLFESQQKVIQTTDQVLAAVTRELGKF